MTTTHIVTRRFRPERFCTLLMFVTGCMLALSWLGTSVRFDLVPVAIVFSGALIGALPELRPRSTPDEAK